MDFGELNSIRFPSADFVTIRNMIQKGQKWGLPYSEELDKREEIEHTLNYKAIRKDMVDYPDGQFVQYIRSGGPADLKLPFKKVTIKSNYPMEDNAVRKTRKKFAEELQSGYVALRDERSMPIYREIRQGAIPKSRVDRKKRAAGLEHDCRTISDYSRRARDGISINEAAGDFGKLDLPQGERYI